MAETQLIPHTVDNAIVHQRASDGYVNATAMCSACNKNFADYFRLANTTAFLNELSVDMGIPISTLVMSKKGGKRLEQGTWIHPDVAIHLGQWCSPAFAVAVSRWVREWLNGNRRGNLPVHLRRYLENTNSIPHTHFSILNELMLSLIAPLERLGYIMPEHLVPDISSGKMFCAWLRDVKKIEPNHFPTYMHRYPDGRVVPAKLYPISLLGDFREHFHEVWIPKRMIAYFQDRDELALEFIPQAFPRLLGPDSQPTKLPSSDWHRK